MELFFKLIMLTILYYLGLILLQRKRAQKLEMLQKEVMGKTKRIEIIIPPKEEIFGATSKKSSGMQIQSEYISNQPTQEPKAREMLFKGTLSDTSTKEEITDEESIIQQTVQQIIEGTSLADKEIDLSPLQEGLKRLTTNNKQTDIPSLNKTDFIPSIDQSKEMKLLYYKDIPQLMDYHKGQKK